ncbi:MAG: hypothetical protein K8U57_37525 [Planctomycetes bacterium]|nr:hypothetical protein [Planctomycetota bacterium]
MSTALNDVASSAFLATGLAPASQSSSPTGSTIDMITADGPCFAVQQVGSFTGDSLDGHIEESANGSSWSAISGAEFAEVTAGSNLQAIQFVRTARYVRYVGTIAGDTPSIAMAVLIGEQKKSL